MRRKTELLTAAVLATSLASCNLLTPLIFIGEHRKKIYPEFDKLAGKRVAILVWTEPATQFDYPYTRLELATYVSDKLSAEMAQRKLGTDVVDSRDVADYIQRNPDAQVDPYAVGKEFKADYVVFIEVLRFEMRDPNQPQFLRGTVEAAISAYDINADPDQLRRYELMPVTCLFPEGPPILMSRTNAPLVRQTTYHKFAEQVARKFYEHTVEL